MSKQKLPDVSHFNLRAQELAKQSGVDSSTISAMCARGDLTVGKDFLVLGKAGKGELRVFTPDAIARVTRIASKNRQAKAPVVTNVTNVVGISESAVNRLIEDRLAKLPKGPASNADVTATQVKDLIARLAFLETIAYVTLGEFLSKLGIDIKGDGMFVDFLKTVNQNWFDLYGRSPSQLYYKPLDKHVDAYPVSETKLILGWYKEWLTGDVSVTAPTRGQMSRVRSIENDC